MFISHTRLIQFSVFLFFLFHVVSSSQLTFELYLQMQFCVLLICKIRTCLLLASVCCLVARRPVCCLVARCPVRRRVARPPCLLSRRASLCLWTCRESPCSSSCRPSPCLWACRASPCSSPGTLFVVLSRVALMPSCRASPSCRLVARRPHAGLSRVALVVLLSRVALFVVLSPVASSRKIISCYTNWWRRLFA